MNLISVERRVKTIMEGFPGTRNDDKQLVVQYMRVYHNIDTFADYATAEGVPPLETITRARRKIQSRGHFIPTIEAVIKQRRKLQQEVAEYARV